MSPPLSVSVCLCLSLSVSVCRCMPLSVSVCLCLSLLFYVCLCLSLSVSVCRCLSLFVSVFFCLPLSAAVFLCLSMSCRLGGGATAPHRSQTLISTGRYRISKTNTRSRSQNRPYTGRCLRTRLLCLVGLLSACCFSIVLLI